MQDSEYEKTNDEQDKGTIEDTDKEVDNKKKENTEEEKREDIEWQHEDKEEEREKIVPSPLSEADSIMKQVYTEELVGQITEEKLIELEDEAKEKFLKHIIPTRYESYLDKPLTNIRVIWISPLPFSVTR